MIEFAILGTGIAILSSFVTVLVMSSKISKANEEAVRQRSLALRWHLSADFYEGECTIRYNDSLDSWQVVRGHEPYITAIANYPCWADESEAKELAEELAETINRLRSYAEE